MAMYEVDYLDGSEKKTVYVPGSNGAEAGKKFSSMYPNVSAKDVMTDVDIEKKNQIAIADIKMPFISMVAFMVKAAIAAIPAFIILFLLGAVLGMFGGGGRF